MDLTAIDVLLDPDETMVGMAMAANARLRAVFPGGFALDGDHAPHITIIQRFVRSAELGDVETAVAGIVRQWNPGALELEATGMYFLSWQQLGVPGITVAPTPELLALQQALIDAVAPFSEHGARKLIDHRFRRSAELCDAVLVERDQVDLMRKRAAIVG